MINIAFRADANAQIGSGHLHRCLALAYELVRVLDCRILFVTNYLDDSLCDLIESQGFERLSLEPSKHSIEQNLGHSHWLSTSARDDVEQLKEYLKENDIGCLHWVICDHYGLDAKYHKLLYQFSCRVLVIDDLADRELYCDLLIDQTFNRDKRDYDKRLTRSGCRVLVGSRYALLREEFFLCRAQSRPRKPPIYPQILVFMGSGDPLNLSEVIIRALIRTDRLKNLNIKLVLGGVNPHLEKIRAVVNQQPNIELLVDHSQMAELMLACDIAIGASGSASWERCCLGLPTITIKVAGNQSLISDGLLAVNAALDGGDATIKNGFRPEKVIESLLRLLDEPGAYQKVVENCLAICDGLGAQRVVERMQDLSLGENKL